MRPRLVLSSGLSLLLACASSPVRKEAASQPLSAEQLARSNDAARVLLDVMARFSPEQASRFGVAGLDDRISDFTPGHRARKAAALQTAMRELQARAQAERDPVVAQNLDILVRAAEREQRGEALRERQMVPSLNVARFVYGSLRSLLDPQVAEQRRAAALVRLRRYAGLEPGTRPLTELSEDETREALQDPAKARPWRDDLENELSTGAVTMAGIEKLFADFHLDAKEPLEKFRAQLAAHEQFVRTVVLPQARADFRLPPDVYAFALENYGVDLPVAQLTAMAHASFQEIQAQMQALATQIAQQRGWPDADYRAVIRNLKKEQIPDDELLAHYNARLAEIERIIAGQHLVTLPSRPARIRIGTEAESAQQPAPHMNPPRLIDNHGEQGEFVLPLGLAGKDAPRYDDFSYAAASWTLTAHEARPGHELQFSTMVEKGVPLARAIFAFNSVNVEGWGLYAEAITLPFMPKEGQLVSLQLRLQRAARAFVDPELQQGKWTPQSAREFLVREVGLSPAFAASEVERYTFRAPGQATSYFYGYVKLLALRKEAEARGGFDAQRFHDGILAQGLLPPDLLRKAILGSAAQ